MYSSITIQHIQEILIRVSRGEEVTFQERLYIQQAADNDQTVMAWLTKALRMQQGNNANTAIDNLMNGLNLSHSHQDSIYKPEPDDLGNWFSGAPSWVARS